MGKATLVGAEWGIERLESPRVRHFRELLQARPGDDPETIRRNYRRMARQLHPDRNPDSPEAQQAFAEVAEAWRLLSRPEKVAAENEAFRRGLGAKVQVGGRMFDAGAFFGLRIFRRYREGARIRRRDRLLAHRPNAAGTPAPAPEAEEEAPILESQTSILDSYEWDLVELYFGGLLTPQARAAFQKKFSLLDDEGLNRLPWYRRNLEGFYAFSERRFDRAVQLFRDANELVPRNIVILYRYGLAQEALAADPARRLAAGERRYLMERAVRCYETAIAVGAARTYGPAQLCLTVRKQLADAWEALGRRRRARAAWREILALRPDSAEAACRRLELAPVKLLARGADALTATVKLLLPAPRPPGD